MVDIYCIYGGCYIYDWLLLHLWLIITFMGDIVSLAAVFWMSRNARVRDIQKTAARETMCDTAVGKPVGYLTGEIEIWTRDNRKKIQLEAIKGSTLTQGFPRWLFALPMIDFLSNHNPYVYPFSGRQVRGTQREYNSQIVFRTDIFRKLTLGAPESQWG